MELEMQPILLSNTLGRSTVGCCPPPYILLVHYLDDFLLVFHDPVSMTRTC